MKTIFLSSPYMHPDPEEMNMRALIAGNACAWLVREGYLPMSPIAHWHGPSYRNNLPRHAAAWRDWNRRWLEAADMVAMLRVPGWRDSLGMAEEMDWAKRAGKPVAVIELADGEFRWGRTMTGDAEGWGP